MKVGEVTERDVPRGVAAFMREVRSILNGGVRFADQFSGGVRTLRFNGDPVLVSASKMRPPLAVLCLSMREVSGNLARVTSGAPLTWRHSLQGIYIDAVGGATPGTEYEIAVAIVEG